MIMFVQVMTIMKSALITRKIRFQWWCILIKKRKGNTMPIIKIKKEDLLHDVTVGLKNQEIAEKYGVTLQCVKQRLYTLYKKMGVRNRAELISVLNDNAIKKEECPYCGCDELYIESESSEDLSFRRECCCSRCERYFTLNYDLKLTSILEVE